VLKLLKEAGSIIYQ